MQWAQTAGITQFTILRRATEEQLGFDWAGVHVIFPGEFTYAMTYNKTHNKEPFIVFINPGVSKKWPTEKFLNIANIGLLDLQACGDTTPYSYRGVEKHNLPGIQRWHSEAQMNAAQAQISTLAQAPGTNVWPSVLGFNLPTATALFDHLISHKLDSFVRNQIQLFHKTVQLL